jgi:hypothetical protein
MWMLIVFALLATPTPPPGEPIGTPTPLPPVLPVVSDFQAVWGGTGRALITWTSSAPLLCVGKHNVEGAWTFLDCKGSPLIDPAPAPGDRYTLMAGGGWVLAQADLQGIVFLPMVQQ